MVPKDLVVGCLNKELIEYLHKENLKVDINQDLNEGKIELFVEAKK